MEIKNAPLLKKMVDGILLFRRKKSTIVIIVMEGLIILTLNCMII